MRIDNEFSIGLPIDAAWETLTDLDVMAGCLPGAQLISVDGDTYTGRVTIKVGPMTTEYVGTASLTTADRDRFRAVVTMAGKDSRGAGTTSAVINAQLRAVGDVTVVTLDTDLAITGKVAQFGSSVIKEVASKLLSQFVANLAAIGASSRG